MSNSKLTFPVSMNQMGGKNNFENIIKPINAQWGILMIK